MHLENAQSMRVFSIDNNNKTQKTQVLCGFRLSVQTRLLLTKQNAYKWLIYAKKRHFCCLKTSVYYRKVISLRKRKIINTIILIPLTYTLIEILWLYIFLSRKADICFTAFCYCFQTVSLVMFLLPSGAYILNFRISLNKIILLNNTMSNFGS